MIITCPACSTQFRVDGTKISPTGTKVRCAKCSHVWLQTPDKALPYPGVAAPRPQPAASPSPEPRREPPPPQTPPFGPPNRPVAEAAVQAPPPAFIAPRPAPAQPVMPPLRTPEPLRAMPEPEPIPTRAPEPQPAERPFDRPRPAVPPRPPRPAAPFPSEEPARQGGLFGLLTAFIPFGVVILLVGGLIYGVLHFHSQITARVPVLERFYDLIGLGPAVTDLGLQNVTYGRTYEDGVPILEVRGEVVNKGPRTIDLPRIQAVLRDKDGTVLARWTFAVAPSKPQITGKETVGFISRYPSPPPHAVSLALSFAAHGAN